MLRTSESAPTSDPFQQQKESHDRPVVAEFKIVLVGDSGVGKSTFLDRFGGERTHDTTNNADIRSLMFSTTIGLVKLNIWESPAKIEPEGLKEGFILGADYGIMMFDFDSRVSYKNIPLWLNTLRKIQETLPVALVGNKIEIQGKKIKERSVTFHRKKNLLFNYISAKANYNIEKPFVSIIRKLTGEEKLELLENPCQQPPEVMITLEQMKSFEEGFEWNPIPEDDDF